MMALNAELNPQVALSWRWRESDLSLVDDDDPYRHNRELAEKQAELFDYASRGWSRVWPRSSAPRDGVEAGGLVRLAGSRIHNLSLSEYSARPVDMLHEADKLLDIGLPVFTRLTTADNSRGHFAVILRKDDAPSRSGYLVYDPWTGITQPVARADALSNSLGLGVWQKLARVYLLGPRDVR